MKRGSAAFALVSAAAALLLIASATLAGDAKVLLVGPSSADATVTRVRQELLLLGIEVEVMAPDPKVDLAALAKERGAAAAARVEDTPPEIVLWVGAQHSAGAAQETRVSEGLSGRAEPGLLALRAVELLRGRLLPVPATVEATGGGASAVGGAAPSASLSSRAVASAAPSAEGSASPGPAAAPLRPSRGSLHLGPALSISPGGVPATPALRLGGGWRVAAPLELSGLLLIPLATGTVSAPEGEMDLLMVVLGAGANVHFMSPTSAFSLHAGGGLGAAGFFFNGRAAAPWVSASGNHWAALPFLEVGAGYRMSATMAVRADVLAALARPEPVLVIAEQRVASFGTPALLASISLEVHP